MRFCVKEMTTRCQAMVQHGHTLEGMGSLSPQQQVASSEITKEEKHDLA